MVDKLADQVEISRLVEMKVLVEEKDFKGEIHGKLTTKMVRDWRRKLYVCDGQSRERWMRRSRLVAREYAIEKRDDCYSPATGAHTANLLPVLYLMQQSEAEGMSSDYEPTLCSLDIKDAFLQVPQREPIRVYLNNVPYIILRNLPGQRQGSKEWYWHFRQFLTDELGFQWCDIQPCQMPPYYSMLMMFSFAATATISTTFSSRSARASFQRTTMFWEKLDQASAS